MKLSNSLDRFSSSSNLLERSAQSSRNHSDLSSHQSQIGQLLENAVDQVKDWRSLATMAVGGLAYRFGRMGLEMAESKIRQAATLFKKVEMPLFARRASLMGQLGLVGFLIPKTAEASEDGEGSGNPSSLLKIGFSALAVGGIFHGLKKKMPGAFFLGIASGLHALALHGIQTYAERLKSPFEIESEKRRKALIAEAQAALKDRGNQKIAHDRGHFTIQSETVDPLTYGPKDLKTLLDYWDLKINLFQPQLETISDPRKKTYRLLSGLYFDFFHHYAGKSAQSIDFLLKEKGNCVAQTKLAVAAMERMGIQLPENEGLGIQVFKNHVQPVLYKKGDDGKIVEVQSLITGKKLDKVVAPIYHSDILYVGFLNKQRASSPLRFEDLLIEKSSPENVSKPERWSEWFDRSQTDVEFPATDAIFDGDAPDDAFLPPPEFEEPSQSGSSDSTHRDAGPTDPLSASAIFHLFKEDPGLKDWPIDILPRVDGIYFRTQEEKDQILTMKNAEEVQRFWKTLVQISLKRLEDHPNFKKAQALYADPYREISHWKLDDFSEVQHFLGQVDWAMRAALMANDLLSLDASEDFLEAEADDINAGHGVFPDRLFDRRKRKIFKDLPQWEKLEAREKSFIDSMTSEFFAFANSLNGPKQRKGFIAYVIGLWAGHEGAPQDRRKDFLKMFLDPNIVGLASESVAETPYKSIEDEKWIDLDLVPEDPSSSSPEKKTSKTSLMTPSPPAKVQISPETMIDFLIYFGRNDPKTLQRWDNSLAEFFRQIGQDGNLDAGFKLVFYLWVGAVMNKDIPGVTVKTPPPSGDKKDHDYSALYNKISRNIENELVGVPPGLLATWKEIRRRRGAEFFSSPLPGQNPITNHPP